MSRFAEQALSLLDAAESATIHGEPCAEMTILMTQNGIRMVADSDWPLDSLASHHGALSAYRISHRSGSVRVEGREGFRTCVLESPNRSHTARFLLAAR